NQGTEVDHHARRKRDAVNPAAGVEDDTVVTGENPGLVTDGNRRGQVDPVARERARIAVNLDQRRDGATAEGDLVGPVYRDQVGPVSERIDLAVAQIGGERVEPRREACAAGEVGEGEAGGTAVAGV